MNAEAFGRIGEAMKRYQTLLFDADRTLLDFDAAEKHALQHTFEKHQLPFNETIEQAYMAMNQKLWKDYEDGLIDRHTVIYTRFGKLFDQFGLSGDGVAFEDDYQAELGRGHQLIEHALDVVVNLKKTHDLYIVTNGVTATQYSRLKKSGLDQHFKKLFVSEECGYQKPQKEYFDVVFQHIAPVNKEEVLIIGDSLSSDILGGINAGIHTCWFNPKKERNDKQLRIDHEIRDLRELYTIVGGADHE